MHSVRQGTAAGVGVSGAGDPSEEPARETYAKLHANTSGPGHQGQTSQEAQAALDEIDRLRAALGTLRQGVLTLAGHLDTACNPNVNRTYCWTHECELDDETICVGEAARRIIEAVS